MSILNAIPPTRPRASDGNSQRLGFVFQFHRFDVQELEGGRPVTVPENPLGLKTGQVIVAESHSDATFKK